MSCKICDYKLRKEELLPYKKVPGDNLEGYTLLCKSHWCKCMPDTTPWNWVNHCSDCENIICKSCWCLGKSGDRICSNCHSRENRLK